MRHDELRSRERRDLRIHVLSRHLERPTVLDKIADLAQESGRRVGIPAPREKPPIDLRLQRIATLQEGAVARAELVHDVVEQAPHAVGRDAACRGRSSSRTRSCSNLATRSLPIVR